MRVRVRVRVRMWAFICHIINARLHQLYRHHCILFFGFWHACMRTSEYYLLLLKEFDSLLEDRDFMMPVLILFPSRS